jgi:uncharacterized protein (TIGR03083 family)
VIPLAEQIATTWRAVDELCAGLTDDEWRRPTGCPGWTVQDQLAHLIDYEATALGRPRPDHTVADLSHTQNELGAANEVGVDARRGHRPAEVLAEFRDVTAARLEQLARLAEDELDAEAQTPIGKATLRDALTLRVMDSWSHEQDIRRAVGRPGHEEGPVVATTVAYFCQFLPFIVGKRAAAPEGSTAVFVIGDQPPFAIEVVDGRARVAEVSPDEATVVLRMDAPQFAALVGGRSDASTEAVEVTGDVELGRRILEQMAFLP